MKQLLRFWSIALSLLGLLTGPGFTQQTAREMPTHSIPTPEWTNAVAFEQDAFTFVRIKYSVNGKYGYGSTPERWLIDTPDSDLNFSFRLQQMTSMKVNPKGLSLEITDQELFNYPFIYIVKPGRITFNSHTPTIVIERRVPNVRRFLGRAGMV